VGDDDDPALLLRRRHAGARVLVVEDNPVNSEVAEALLQAVGLVACCTDSGLAALQQLARARHDLVLMDMQLPGMDGLEATRRIRRDPALARLPVIAMTANAFAEDRQACLAAGMSDFVAKPVQPRALYGALLRGLDAAARQPVAPLPTQPTLPVPPMLAAVTAPPASPAADPLAAALTELLGDQAAAALARLRGDAQRLQRLLGQFVQRQQPDGARLAALLETAQTSAARALAHELKGVAATLGAGQLAELALEIEHGLRGGEPGPALAPQARAMQTELQRLADGLASLPASPGMRPTLPPTWQVSPGPAVPATA
jgi:CheY-like chemotaxis protein